MSFRNIRLAFALNSRFVDFAVVGMSGSIVDLSSFFLLTGFMELRLARALAIGLAMTWTFVWNRNYTFRQVRQQRSIAVEYFGFCASCTLGAVANWSVSCALFPIQPWVALIAGVAAGAGINFMLCSRVLWPTRT